SSKKIMDCERAACSGCELPYLNVKSAADATEALIAAPIIPARILDSFVIFFPRKLKHYCRTPDSSRRQISQ
ncbi:MAG: hypothetical protein OXC26_03345, partial [Albidovulum sp.]|nr:hypothetical protein [Albidovulum sp.]